MSTFLALVAIVGALAWITAWSRKKTVWRHVAIVLFMIFVPACAVGVLQLLGQPYPAWNDTKFAHGTKILGFYLVKGKAIYLLLLEPGALEPRYYVLPWNNEEAEQLERAQRKALEKGDGKLEFQGDKDSQKVKPDSTPDHELPAKR
jgi:uncharacterized membrane protein YfcA